MRRNRVLAPLSLDKKENHEIVSPLRAPRDCIVEGFERAKKVVQPPGPYFEA
ncbi:unnamed protein product [Tenebrio molitor]|nr:unnamed protein product [Tenebrio molitor]